MEDPYENNPKDEENKKQGNLQKKIDKQIEGLRIDKEKKIIETKPMKKKKEQKKVQ